MIRKIYSYLGFVLDIIIPLQKYIACTLNFNTIFLHNFK